ncbi:hypothetical protein [Anaerofustis butyriciformans]|uniref:hypothetical protein n=1 Tax=Anaerofustis butyriciformans TaxID=3108533 RepID=UPI002E327805|nr:hypothetical protein [Anaerofustis sp. HA2171]
MNKKKEFVPAVIQRTNSNITHLIITKKRRKYNIILLKKVIVPLILDLILFFIGYVLFEQCIRAFAKLIILLSNIIY